MIDLVIKNVIIPKESIGLIEDVGFHVKWKVNNEIINTYMTCEQLSALLSGGLIEVLDAKNIAKNKPLYKVGDMVKTSYTVGFIEDIKYDGIKEQYSYYIKQLYSYFDDCLLEQEYEKNITLVDNIEDEVYINGELYTLSIRKSN